MTEKRYYWIKLKTNFFSLDEIDFLLSQENGCKYIVLYQMLCLNTANNNGEMSSKIGEMIVPYDINKIVRDTKYFDYDTVVVALELFKKLGLVYEEENKILKITNFDDMVGSETGSAKKVREWRDKKRLQCNQNVTNNVIQEIEYRDKSIEIRDIDKEKEKKKDKEKNNNIDILSCYENNVDTLCVHDGYIGKDSIVAVATSEILSRLNELTDSNFKPSGKATKDLIKNLLKDYTKEDILMVVDKMCYKWGKDKKMSEYLRPSTLFRRSNFENYYGMKVVKEETTIEDYHPDLTEFFKEDF